MIIFYHRTRITHRGLGQTKFHYNRQILHIVNYLLEKAIKVALGMMGFEVRIIMRNMSQHVN